MGCDRCDECRQRGDRFCIYCGEMLDSPYPDRNGCDRCEECLRNGNDYCIYCGKKLTKSENPFMIIGFVIGMITAVLMSSLLIFEWMAALIGIPSVLPNLPDYGSTLIIVVPWIVEVVSFNGLLSQIYYILLILAVTTSIGFYFFMAIKPAKKLLNGDIKSIRKTAFYEVPVLFCVLFFWEMAFVLILQGFGVATEGLPDRDTWIWMYELLEASVWEEVITRLMLIGLPMMLIAIIRKKDPKTSWKFLFGGFGINKTVIVLIFFSAFIFGAGHLNNWGWWKFFTTFAFGLIAGYLFSRYGIYSTIALHFMTDYMEAEAWIMGYSAPILTTLMFMGLSLACVPFTYIYVKRGVLALSDVFKDHSNDLR